MENKNKIQQRRPALKKMGIGGILAGVAMMSSGRWVKPVAETVILPAHAETTTPLLCYDVRALVFDFVFDPVGSGGNGSFKIELLSDAPDTENQLTITSSSVSSGTLTTPNTGQIYQGNSLVFAWVGAVIPTTPVPMDPLNSGGPVFVSVEWQCATGTTGVLDLNLSEMVRAEEPNW